MHGDGMMAIGMVMAKTLGDMMTMVVGGGAVVWHVRHVYESAEALC